MKYFKNNPTNKIGRNDGEAWQKIVELFTPKDAKDDLPKPKFFRGIREFIIDLQNYNMQKQIVENKRLMSSPILGEY